MDSGPGPREPHRNSRPYGRRPPLVLVNGLAEQAESWFANHSAWRRRFDVHMPNVLAYEGEALHRRIASGRPVDVPYLADRLAVYLDEFVQTPPYFLAASSLGGQVAAALAARRPEIVARLVLLCPSGCGGAEQLPVMPGVRRGDPAGLVDSVFFDPRRIDPGLLDYYRGRFASRAWRTGLLHTLRGTAGQTVLDLLPRVQAPTLVVCGREDRIVEPAQVREAVRLLPRGRFVMLGRCGHAPQLERPGRVNRLVADFLGAAELGCENGEGASRDWLAAAS